MNNERDKIKKISDVIGSSFEEHLARAGKQSKQSSLGKVRESNAPSYRRQNAGQNRALETRHNVSNRRGLTNPNSQKVLDEYHRLGKSEQILRVWAMLMQAFDSKMKHYFGEEPDSHFMHFAADLTPDSFARLQANLLERLDEDREWPPSLIRLKQLANSPTKEVMYQARQHLFHAPVPINKLDRVELFVKKHKMREVRSLPEKNFEREFNRKYIQWFRDVIFHDMDITLEERQQEISRHVQASTETHHDQAVNKIISQGQAFENPMGARIKSIIGNKHIQVDEITDDAAFVKQTQTENQDSN
ncbi:hypothetical protein VEZ01S_44_00330 [Vibrio ezurae NBRC 102218]|uniref:Uncharacterized protein n=2 Tax=Vibrio ezurae TaxID=252583 RepID=U3B4H9_9VIBR|nr:hypothetical protein VEZ01S_44_00330 [Vibrio ezurae NBRC 102218]